MAWSTWDQDRVGPRGVASLLPQYQCIAEGGYDLSKGERFAFGMGVYSSPHIDVAACYAQDYQYDGKSYKMVFQNRIRDNFEVVPSYKTGTGEYWVSPSDRDIRPYGICIKGGSDGYCVLL